MESLEEIYRKYAQTVYKFLLVQTNNRDLAEELTQETFFQAVKSIHKYKGKSSMGTWLCGIAKNLWHEYLRKNRQHEQFDETLTNPISSVENHYFVEWDNVQVLKLLHKLNEPMREVMYLRLIGNLTFYQIGEIMDKSENWARVTYYRGKERVVKEAEQNGK